MNPETVRIVVTVLLSGGIFGAVATLLTSRANARKTNVETDKAKATLPAEVDSVVVQGAEAAVLTMKQALDSAQDRITQLEKERENDRHRIGALERKVDELRKKVERAEDALGVARRASDDLRRELEAFLTESNGRP